MDKLKKLVFFLIIMFFSLLLGSGLGRISGFSLDSQNILYRYVSTGFTLSLPLNLDLKVLLIDFRMKVVVNALSIITMVLSGLLFFKLYP